MPPRGLRDLFGRSWVPRSVKDPLVTSDGGLILLRELGGVLHDLAFPSFCTTATLPTARRVLGPNSVATRLNVRSAMIFAMKMLRLDRPRDKTTSQNGCCL